ncbi:MAG: hypothetical protein KI793_24885 [Rivularia sp. (in: Bacteria)]|nr:hypothetical protein [Rivularia sp. MS3]
MKYYDASMIHIVNIPHLKDLGDNKCGRTYHYCFANRLPKQKVLNKIANKLEQRYLLDKDRYEIPEDIEIIGYVKIKRLTDYKARITYFGTKPEEDCIYISGIHTLPLKIEKVLGKLKSIQGQPRDWWFHCD